MFRIHEHQIEHFARKLRADFERRMAAYLKASYADCVEGMTDEEIALWVSAAADTAVQHGIKTEPEVASLMLLLLVLGLDVEETAPWAHEVLTDRALRPEGKIAKLTELARANGVPGIEAVVFDEPQKEIA